MAQPKDLDNRFTFHKAREGQPEMYVAIRDKAREFAEVINTLVPDSREQSLAFTALEEAVFWANAGIARH